MKGKKWLPQKYQQKPTPLIVNYTYGCAPKWLPLPWHHKCLILLCRKKLKQKILSTFPALTPEHLEDLLPSKIPLFVIRLVTFGGVVVTTYHTEGDPIFFDHASGACPSSEYALIIH